MHAQPPLAAATDEPPQQRAPVQLELELLDDGGRGRRRGRQRRWRDGGDGAAVEMAAVEKAAVERGVEAIEAMGAVRW